MVSLAYSVEYYKDGRDRLPAFDYIEGLPKKDKAKVYSFIKLLSERGGYLDEPYAKKVEGTKFRELIVDFARNRHRVFYFTTRGQRIILLHAFFKKTPKTPPSEIARGVANYEDFIANFF